jgi:hypothetical protein
MDSEGVFIPKNLGKWTPTKCGVNVSNTYAYSYNNPTVKTWTGFKKTNYNNYNYKSYSTYDHSGWSDGYWSEKDFTAPKTETKDDDESEKIQVGFVCGTEKDDDDETPNLAILDTLKDIELLKDLAWDSSFCNDIAENKETAAEIINDMAYDLVRHLNIE